MNASDIIKAKQNRVLYQAYYRPTIFSTLITSTINYCPVSTINIGGNIVSSVVSCITMQYGSKCEKPIISYELMNDINNGRYQCGFPYCSTITEWNTGQTFPIGDCNCKISFLTWKNTNTTTFNTYSTINYSTVCTFTTTIATGPSPIICPFTEFNQGTNFASRCDSCNTTLYGNNSCCCASGQ
jgi:hypothetical protein